MADAAELSKSAKKRAAKKARDEAHGEEEAPPPPPPAVEPKAKAKGKAKSEPKAATEPQAAAPKAKSEPKAKAKSEPKAEAKAKGKAKAAPQEDPKPAPAPPKDEPKAKGKAKAKGKSKPAPVAEPEPVEEAPKPNNDELINYIMDDGKGGEWEVASGLSKKKEKEQARKVEQQAFLQQQKAAGVMVGAKNTIPGMATADPKALAAAKASASQAASADVARILAMKSGEVAVVEEPVGNQTTVTIEVPEKKLGWVIGPKGATMNLIKEKTKVKGIDMAGNAMTITGAAAAVEEAQNAIEELIAKGFCSLQYDDFSENFVSVHPTYLPALVGEKGAVIIKIKDGCKVQINMPSVPPNPPPGKKFKVTIAGEPKNVELAKEVINAIVMYGHHEITHPGQVHAELEVDNWSLRYIIGKGGSEMKHIQRNWDVKLVIPRDHSANQNVVVVGELGNVERAQAYIEKVMWNAADVAKGRDRTDRSAGDDFGEEEVEDWMRPYLYKR